MEKGKFGIRLAVIAVLAFCFTALLQPIPVLLVAGFALLAEKDEWLNKQVLQALLLTICYYLVTLVTDWVFGGITRFFGWVELFGAQNAVSILSLVVDGIVQLAVIVFSVIAVVRVLRGKDAGLPWLSKLASGDYSSAKPQQPYPAAPYGTAAAAAPVFAAQSQPVPAYAAYAPTPSAAFNTPPVTAVQAQTAPAVRLCPACSSPLQDGTRFCTQCGANVE